MAMDALAEIASAYRSPGAIADSSRAAGKKIIRHLGTDLPLEMLVAAGFIPVRLAPVLGINDMAIDGLTGTADLSWRGRSLMRQLYEQANSRDALLISHANAEQPQLFAALRDSGQWLGLRLGPAHLLDMVHLPRTTSRDFNRVRLAEFRSWLETLTGSPISDNSIQVAIKDCNAQKAQIERIAALRHGGAPRISGTDMLRIVGAAAILPMPDHANLLDRIFKDRQASEIIPGRRIFMTGSLHEDALIYEQIEALDAVIVGEDHQWGDPWHRERPDERLTWLDALADPALRTPLPIRSAPLYAAELAARAAETGADVILHLNIEADEAAPWNAATSARAAAACAIPILILDIPATGLGDGDIRDRLIQFLAGSKQQTAKPTSVHPPSEQKPDGPRAKPAERPKSRKSLASVASFGTYQREWFADVRRRTAAGEPFGMMNANAPQEILRTLDIPFVVNQWWASIVAAKQQSGRYIALLKDHGFPTEVEAYSAQGLAAAFDEDSAQAPWGGLPRPDFLFALTSSDATPKLFEHWAEATGAELFLFERTVEPRWSVITDWWDALPDRWDEALESVRLDLLVAELKNAIGLLEQRTRRTFDWARFTAIMTLVNEQEEYYRKTRDLIARTVPAPAAVVDTMPATMVPQWHRGTEWARDAAKAFYEEVLARVTAEEPACAGERVRLMWIGRGMWNDMGFYQRWENSHGAVFIWSMYLSLAADGYIRNFDHGRDPLRALAARVMTMGDELRMPSWAGAWHVREAETHAADGAVALSDADPTVLQALENAGIPVLRLGIDNYNPNSVAAHDIVARITEFIEGPAARQALKRHTA